jgi:phosphatidyl-myo-inositol dimannoside synthase
MRHVVVMVASSYPRFPGDHTGSFMEPIARGVAALGHEVHMVAPWHPLVLRPAEEAGVQFHFYRYAPFGAPHTFGYGGSLHADVTLRLSALAVTPLAVAAGIRTARRVARTAGATMMHGHWVVPGGFMARRAVGASLPLVTSLHGSDVYMAERHALVRRAAAGVFRSSAWVTACSEDLRSRAIALGADRSRSEVVPYGVDTARFRPSTSARHDVRARLNLPDSARIVFTAGRLVSKKGFEYLIDASARLARRWPDLKMVIAGGGDLDDALRARARDAGVGAAVIFMGSVAHHDMPALLAAADIVAVPSIRDEAGNVDGLPNVVMEALASGTPIVATPAGGIASVVEDGRTGLLVPERDADALAAGIESLLTDADRRASIGRAARHDVDEKYTWERVATRFAQIYDLATEYGVEQPESGSHP